MLQLSFRKSMNLTWRGTMGAVLLCWSLFPTLITTSGVLGKARVSILPPGSAPTHMGWLSGKLANICLAWVTGMPNISASLTALLAALAL